MGPKYQARVSWSAGALLIAHIGNPVVILRIIPTNNINELNELIYAGAKLVCEKNWDPLKKHEEIVKTGMGNSTGNAN